MQTARRSVSVDATEGPVYARVAHVQIRIRDWRVVRVVNRTAIRSAPEGRSAQMADPTTVDMPIITIPQECRPCMGVRGSTNQVCCGGCSHSGITLCTCNGAGNCFCVSVLGGCQCPSNPGFYKSIARTCSTQDCYSHCATQSNELCRAEDSRQHMCSCSTGFAKCIYYNNHPRDCHRCDGSGFSGTCSDGSQVNCPGWGRWYSRAY